MHLAPDCQSLSGGDASHMEFVRGQSAGQSVVHTVGHSNTSRPLA